MIDFDKLQVNVIEEKDKYGKFEVGPITRGFGNTLANPLRRVLLSSLDGSAPTSVKISGVKHEYSTIKGVSEDVLQIVLNVKRLIVRSHSDKTAVIKLSATGPGKVTAADFEETSDVEIANKDLEIATLADKKSKLELEVTVEQGVGYQLADGLERSKIGVIPLDANFSPVVRVNFEIVDARVGRRTDFDKVVMEIHTNGTVKPSDCMTEAAEILVKMYAALAGESKLVKQILEKKDVEEVEEVVVEEEVEVMKLTDLDLPTRALNSLENAGIKTTEGLTKMSAGDLETLEGLGKKSIDDIEKALAKQGLGLKE